MNFGEVLSKAGTVIWRNKILWLFGILAGCGGNRSSGGSFNYQFSSEDFRTGDLPEPLRRMGEWIVQFFNNTPGYVYIVAAVVVLALIILAIYLSTMGRIGLVLGVDRFLDMCRTTLNVTGDLAAAVVVSKGESDPPLLTPEPMR